MRTGRQDPILGDKRAPLAALAFVATLVVTYCVGRWRIERIRAREERFRKWAGV